MKLFKDTKTLYYKYGTWSQATTVSGLLGQISISDPQLSGSTIDTPTSPTFSNQSITDYQSITNPFIKNGYFTVNKGSKTYSVIDLYFSNKLKISKIYINGSVVVGYASSITGSIIYDISSGTPVHVSTQSSANTNTHTFSRTCTAIRICIRPDNNGDRYPSRITEITITAQQRVEGSPTDYTETQVIDIFKAFQDGNKLKGVL